jgi:alpha-glucosidase
MSYHKEMSIAHPHITTQKQLLLTNLMEFYKYKENLQKMMEVINGESNISLRIVDWFVTNYAKKYFTVYEVPKFVHGELSKSETTRFKVFNEYNPPRVAVAEAYVQAKRRMLYARPDELGQAFNFDLLTEDFDARRFKKVISDNIRLAKSEGSSSTWVLDNHDRVRHATRYGLPMKTNFIEWLLSDGKSAKLDRALGLARANAATMMLLALPGCTYIYQGEELGLFEVEDIPQKDLQDPMWFRNVVPQMVKGKVSGLALIHTEKGRDGCRVPLPWDSTKPSFGFGQEKSHLPQPQWFANHAVDKQDGIKGSTLSLYRDALALRKKLQTDEELQWIPTTNPEVIHFARPNGWQCIMNFNAKSYKLPAGKVVLSSGPIVGGKIGANTTVWLSD